MDKIYIHHIHPHSLFPCAHHLSLVPNPGKDIPSYPSVLKIMCILIIHEGFVLILWAHIYYG
jgi:hypothetical protein